MSQRPSVLGEKNVEWQSKEG